MLTAGLFAKDVGWILLAFAIFNTYMLIWSTQVNLAVFAVFLTLEATEIVLFAGNFAGNANIVKAGGYVGVLTALCAWYASAAGVANGMGGRAHVAGRQPAARAAGLSDHPDPGGPFLAPRDHALSGPGRMGGWIYTRGASSTGPSGWRG